MIPWLASVSFHVGVGLIAVFVIYWTYHAFTAASDRAEIIVPSSFEDPAFSEHPGGNPHPGQQGDPSQEAAQDRLKELVKSNGWVQNNASQDVTSLLKGAGEGIDAQGIFAGAGATVGSGPNGNASATGNDPAAFGQAGGGAGNAPRTSYYGSGGNARKIVYIIDNSGSMVDDYQAVKRETERSVGNLVPLQFFGVVTVSDHAIVIAELARATPENKAGFIHNFASSVAEGANDETLEPFKNAFEDALRMKPDLIYFLTDGGFHPSLVPTVKQLNQSVAAKICTLEFDRYNGAARTDDTEYTVQLKELAAENGGVYRLVSDKDAGH